MISGALGCFWLARRRTQPILSLFRLHPKLGALSAKKGAVSRCFYSLLTQLRPHPLFQVKSGNILVLVLVLKLLDIAF